MASRGFSEDDVPDQSGRGFVVTGANTGIGFEAARVLAARGARVVLACRDQGKAETAMDRIRQASPGAELAFAPLDQADLASVRAAAARIAEEPRLDGLVNNAGVMVPPLTRTKQGFELQFGVNHLGSFALTALLLPKLAETPGARVVVTSSLAHRRGRMNWDDLNAERKYSRGAAYNQSKLANALFAVELDRRLRAAGSPVTAVGCHPGVAGTDLGRHIGAAPVLFRLLGPFINSPAMGAWPTLLAATGPVKPGGFYGPTSLREMRGLAGEAVLDDKAKNPEDARRLWDVSVAMTGVEPAL